MPQVHATEVHTGGKPLRMRIDKGPLDGSAGCHPRVLLRLPVEFGIIKSKWLWPV